MCVLVIDCAILNANITVFSGEACRTKVWKRLCRTFPSPGEAERHFQVLEEQLPPTATTAPPLTAGSAPPLTAGNSGPPLTAGSGGPPLTAGSGAPPLTAGSGGPPLTAGSGGPPLTAGSGAPPLTAGSGAPPLTAGSGAAPLTAGSGAAPLTAGSGAPPLTAGSGGPPLTAGSGAPPLTAGSGGPPLTAGSGGPPLTANSSGPPLSSNRAPLSSATLDTQHSSSEDAVRVCHHALEALHSHEQLEILSLLFSRVLQKCSTPTIPPDFLVLVSDGMQRLHASKRSNVIYLLAKALGTLRSDGSESLMPVNKMPMGLLEYTVNFFTASSIQKVRVIVRDCIGRLDLIYQYVVTVCNMLFLIMGSVYRTHNKV